MSPSHLKFRELSGAKTLQRQKLRQICCCFIPQLNVRRGAVWTKWNMFSFTFIVSAVFFIFENGISTKNKFLLQNSTLNSIDQWYFCEILITAHARVLKACWVKNDFFYFRWIPTNALPAWNMDQFQHWRVSNNNWTEKQEKQTSAFH